MWNQTLFPTMLSPPELLFTPGGNEDESHLTDEEKKQRKNQREKQRRNRLQIKYDQVCLLMDPDKKPRTDKLAIVKDAIKVVHTLNHTNNELARETSALQEELDSLLQKYRADLPP